MSKVDSTHMFGYMVRWLQCNESNIVVLISWVLMSLVVIMLFANTATFSDVMFTLAKPKQSELPYLM